MKTEFRKKSGWTFFALATAVALTVTDAHAVPVYDVTYLRPPAGASSISATSINDSRQVTGYSSQYGGGVNAFITAPITDVFNSDLYASDPFHQSTNLFYRGVIDLGTLGGASSQAWEINNNGQVVGTSNPAGPPATHAFVNDVTTNALIDISTSGANGFGGINDSGQVTGTVSSTGANNSRATRSITYYPTATATAINNNGQMTGQVSMIGTGRNHAFIWDPLTGMTDIGVLDTYTHSVNRSSNGRAINSQGQVVGNSEIRVYDPGTLRVRVHQQAFLWDSTNGMIDLGWVWLGSPRNTFATDINDHGQIVGYAETLGGIKGFLWENGVMYDLNDLINVNFPFPTNINGYDAGINNNGDIVIGNTLLVRQHSNSVPEPAPIALLGLGLLGFGVMRKRRG